MPKQYDMTIQEDPTPAGRFVGYKRRKVNGTVKCSPKFRGDTKTQVAAKYQQWEAAGGWDAKIKPTETVLTVGTYLKRWWNESSPGLRATTRETDECRMKHVWRDEVFCALPFADLKKRQVLEFLLRIPGSDNTRNEVRRLLVRAFNADLKDDENRLLTYNPAQEIPNAPKVKERTSDDIKSWNADEARLIIAHSATVSPYWYAFTTFAFDSGFRSEEILGLQLADFDELRRTVKVRRVLNTVGGKATVSLEAKTSKSHRTIRLNEQTWSALKPWFKTLAGPKAWVFAVNPKYPQELHTRHTLRRQFGEIAAAAGAPLLSVHSTRHTCATLLLQQGANIVAVSARLGHSKVTLTLDTYASAMPEDQDTLAGLLGAILAPRRAVSAMPG